MRNCARCIKAKEDYKRRVLAGEKVLREQCTHCHCKFLDVDEELLADLRNHEPYKRSAENDKQTAAENVTKKIKLDEAANKSKEEDITKLEKEAALFIKRHSEKKDEKKENKAAKKKTTKKIAPIEKVNVTTKKKEKLSFLFSKNDDKGN